MTEGEAEAVRERAIAMLAGLGATDQTDALQVLAVAIAFLHSTAPEEWQVACEEFLQGLLRKLAKRDEGASPAPLP